MNYKKKYGGPLLDEFNVGGTHDENPFGGISIGGNATVEQNETKYNYGGQRYAYGGNKDASYIFSDRFTLSPELLSKNKLPMKYGGKTPAVISKEFNSGSSKIDLESNREMLDRLVVASEEVRPNIEGDQMFLGGFAETLGKIGGIAGSAMPILGLPGAIDGAVNAVKGIVDGNKQEQQMAELSMHAKQADANQYRQYGYGGKYQDGGPVNPPLIDRVGNFIADSYKGQTKSAQNLFNTLVTGARDIDKNLNIFGMDRLYDKSKTPLEEYFGYGLPDKPSPSSITQTRKEKVSKYYQHGGPHFPGMDMFVSA